MQRSLSDVRVHSSDAAEALGGWWLQLADDRQNGDAKLGLEFLG